MEELPFSTIGERLEHAMSASNVSKKRLAACMKVSERTIERWMAGGKISKDINDVASCVGVVGLWLKEGEGPMNATGVKPGKQKHLQDMGEDIRGYLRQLDVSSGVVDSFVESVMNNELSEGSDMVALEGVQVEREGRLTRHTMEHANTIDLKKKRHVRVLIVVEVTEIEETPPKDKPSANKD